MNKNIKSLILAATVGLSTPAEAGPDRVSVLLGSMHIDTTSDFEKFNPGVFLTWENPAIDWTVGAFRNSYGKSSTAAMAGIDLLESEDFSAGLFVGLAHYPGDGDGFLISLGNDIVPLAGIQLRYKNLFAEILPGDGEVVSAVISVGMTWSVK